MLSEKTTARILGDDNSLITATAPQQTDDPLSIGSKGLYGNGLQDYAQCFQCATCRGFFGRIRSSNVKLVTDRLRFADNLRSALLGPFQNLFNVGHFDFIHLPY